jgi:hypothetical protein
MVMRTTGRTVPQPLGCVPRHPFGSTRTTRVRPGPSHPRPPSLGPSFDSRFGRLNVAVKPNRRPWAALARKRTFADHTMDDGNRHATFNRTPRMCVLGRSATAASSPAGVWIGLARAAPGWTFLPIGSVLAALSSRRSSRTGQRRPCSSGLPGCSRGCRARSSRTSCGG